MALTGRLARGQEPAALTTATVLFAATIAALAGASSPALLGLCLVAVGMTRGAFDVCLSIAIARAERTTGARLFQPVHAAFPVMVVVAAPLAGLARQFGVPLPAILLAVAAGATATTTSYAGFAGSPLLVAGLSAVAGLPIAVACLGLLALPLLGAALAGRSRPGAPSHHP